MHSTHVVVPRAFYVDSEEPLDLDEMAVEAAAAAAAAAGHSGPSARAGAAAAALSTQQQLPMGTQHPSTQMRAALSALRTARLVRAEGKRLPGGRKPALLYQVRLRRAQRALRVRWPAAAIASVPFVGLCHCAQLTMSEADYLAHTSVLSAVLSAPHVRGVYEVRGLHSRSCAR